MRGWWERILESWTWLSVQVTAVWSLVWFVFSQLPPEVISVLAQTKFLLLSVPAWMGIGQSVTTYFARIRKAPEK